MPRSVTRIASTAAAMLSAVALAGCGSDDDATGGGAAESGDASAFSRTVDGEVAKLTGPQDTQPKPGPKAVPGKRVAIVTVTQAEEGAKRNIAGLEGAAKALGWKTTIYDGQGVPSTANNRIQQAVTTKPDAIALVGLDANIVQGGLAAAKRAGIPVACATCWDPAADDTRGQYVSAEPPLSQFQRMGYGLAAYAYKRAKGKPRFLVLNDPSLTNLSAREKGFDEFLKECKAGGGQCEVAAKEQFLLANLNTQVPAQAASLARANPDFNAVWVSFDFAALQVINGLRQAGSAEKTDAFAVAANGDGANLKMIESDGFQKATVGISFEWGGYATMDNLNRVFAGEKPVEQEVPIRLFDKANVAEAKDGNWKGDTDFAAAYEQAWSGGS